MKKTSKRAKTKVVEPQPISRQTRRQLEKPWNEKPKRKTLRIQKPVKAKSNPKAPKKLASIGFLGRPALNAGSRSEARKQYADTGSKKYKENETLDKINEADETGYRHPTKGHRKVSVRRGRASIIINAIRQGQIHPVDLRRIKRELRTMGV